MKKMQTLVGTLALSTILMGAGYAAWDKNIDMTTTAKTGKLDVQFINDVRGTDAWVTGTKTDFNQSGYANTGSTHSVKHTLVSGSSGWNGSEIAWTRTDARPTFDNDSHSVTFKVSNLYPGGVVTLDPAFINSGSIPVRFKSAKVERVSGSVDLYNNLRAAASFSYDTDGPSNTTFKKVWNTTIVPGFATDGIGVALANLADSMNNDTNLKKAVLEPEGMMSFGLPLDENGKEFDPQQDGSNCISIMLDRNASNTLQEKECTFKITFDFEQWTTTPGTEKSPFVDPSKTEGGVANTNYAEPLDPTRDVLPVRN